MSGIYYPENHFREIRRCHILWYECGVNQGDVGAHLHLRELALPINQKPSIFGICADAFGYFLHSSSGSRCFSDVPTHLFRLSATSGTGDQPQPDSGYSKNARYDSQAQGSESNRLRRDLLPDGFWLVVLVVFIISASDTVSFMYLVAMRCGWLR